MINQPIAIRQLARGHICMPDQRRVYLASWMPVHPYCRAQAWRDTGLRGLLTDSLFV